MSQTTDHQHDTDLTPAHAFAEALTPQRADLTVVRVAGLTTDACTMTSARTRRLLEELHAARSGVQSGRDAIEDTLFELVPTVDSTELRRSVLAAKRAVHKDQPVPADLIETLATLIDAGAQRELVQWSTAAQRARDLVDDLSDSVGEDTTSAVARLSGALADERFHQSLALAAPDWLRYGKPHRKPRERRNLRTMFSYVSRSAVKTSPFSALTAVGVAGSTGSGQAVSYASTALAHLAARAFARDERTADRLRYRVAPIRPGGPNSTAGLVLLAEPEADGGLAWRLDRITEAEHAVPWAGSMQDGVERSLPELLHELGGAEPFQRFRRLFDSGLITLVAPWQRGNDPLAAVANLVAAQEHPLAAQVHEVLRSSSRLTEMDAKERTDVGVRVRSVAGEWAPAAGLDRFNPGELVYEDVESTHPIDDPATLAPVAEDLDMLGRLSRPYLFRSHLYDVLVDAVVEQFGAGGRVTDVQGFLMRLALDGDSQPALDRASAADQEMRGTINARAMLPVGRTSSPPTMAALYQLAAANNQAVAAGDYRMVVNQFNPGCGGLVSRFSGLLGEQLRGPIRDHIRACWPDADVRELILWTELNTAQSRSSGLLPALTTSSEVTDSQPLDLSQVHLVHDAELDTVELRDPETDQPIGLPYLGLVPPHMFPPYARLMAVLADPWINGSPYSDYVLPYALRTERTSEVVHLPRRTHGRVVAAREAWVVPTDLLPLPEQGEADAELVQRIDQFRREHDLPHEVFVHQLTPTSGAVSTDRKPLWIDLSSPTCAAALAGWLDGAVEHVRLVEALPARTDHPTKDREDRPIATEYVNLLRWTRPEEQQ